jgi:Cu+-exporting ATPase
MSVEEALRRRPGVNSVLVNMVHRVVLVEADMSKIGREEFAARSSIDTEVSL